MGELVAIVVLVLVYLLIRVVSGEQVLDNYTMLALIVLCIFLLQGSIYWWLKLRQLEKASPLRDPRLISYIYVLALLLLLLYPVSLVIALLNDSLDATTPDASVGGGLFVAALVVFIHYSLVKLVRSDTDRIALTRRRQVTARFMRELQRSELRKNKR
jgi:hypothetical protein